MIPRHIAIIMDGNGRWARSRNLPRTSGHKEGAKSVRSVVEECGRLGVQYLTLYAFSLENWKRPKHEITFLMNLLQQFLVREEASLMKNNVVLEAIGRIDDLPDRVLRQLRKTIEQTSRNTGLVAVLALNYGARAEIVDAARKIACQVKDGTLQPDEIDEHVLQQCLYTDSHGKPFPDPDLVIRTAGEMRLSNFLLWQSSYAEIYVAGVCWPDFRAEHLREAIADFGRRERKFGGLKDRDVHQSADGLVLDRVVPGSDAR